MAGLKLRRREWVVLTVGTLFLTAMLATQPARHLWEKYQLSGKQLTQAQTRLSQARELRTIIETERSGRQAIEEQLKNRPANFDLWNFTNQCLRESKIDKYASLDRKRFSGNLDGVQMTLKGVRMSEFVELLHRMYASNSLIVVQKLDHLRAARDAKGLDCQITFMAPRSIRAASGGKG